MTNRNKETTTPGRRDDGTKQRSDTKKRRNDESNMLSTICLHRSREQLGLSVRKRNVMLSFEWLRLSVHKKKKKCYPLGLLGLSVGKNCHPIHSKGSGYQLMLGKKSVKNRPQICPKYLFKNLHGMLPISLKLEKIMSWDFYFCIFLKLLFQILHFLD